MAAGELLPWLQPQICRSRRHSWPVCSAQWDSKHREPACRGLIIPAPLGDDRDPHALLSQTGKAGASRADLCTKTPQSVIKADGPAQG